MITKHTTMVLLGIAIIFYGCTTHNNHQESTNEGNQTLSMNDHDHENQSYTIFNDGYELFIELPELVANKPCEATIHITRLNGYKPLPQQNIHLLFSGNENITIEGHTSTDGIFHADFSINKTGNYELKIGFTDLNIDHLITINKLSVSSNDAHPTEEHEHHHEEAESGLITYLKEQAWSEEFGIIQVKKTHFARIIKTSGTLLPAPGDETIITALHSGAISLNNLLIEGQLVTKGDNIGTIASDLIHQNLTNDFLQAKNQYEKSELDYKRAQELIKEKLISEKEFLETKLYYENAKNTYKNIARFYNDGNENVTATTSGIIRSVFVKEGEFITEGQPIATIIKNKHILLKADLPQQYTYLASGINSANFTPVYTTAVYNTDQLHGKRISYSSALPQNSMFNSVYFEFDATNDIIPGSYAEVYLKSAENHEVLIIPVSALMEDQGNYFVFVMTDGEHFRKTYIKPGHTDGEFIEILSGLTESSYVVDKGTYQVYLASLGNAIPTHTHSH